MFSVCKDSIFFCEDKEFVEKSWIINEIENTRHSSGFGVNANILNNIEPDECVMSHQGVTCLIIKTLGQEYDEWWVKCKTKLKNSALYTNAI